MTTRSARSAARGRAASPARFEGFTVGDVLKARSPRSRVVGVSFKDRAAILMAGKRADAAYWYEIEGGRFVTSSHYMDAAPAWLEAWNARRLPDSFAGRPWERLLADPALYLEYAGEDAVAGEWDRKDTTFPHHIPWLPPADDFYDGLERTPFADTILLEFALAAMAGHHLGEGDATDLLAISFSACDVVGHTYGPDSQEMMDQMLRLDRALGLFLDEVDRRAGEGGSIVVLTADHGVMPLVENLQARGLPAVRAREEDLAQTVDEALAARFPGASDLLADADELEWVLDTEAIARQGLKRADVEQTIRTTALGTGIVDAVYTAGRAHGAGARRRPLLRDAPARLLRPAQRRPDRPREAVRLSHQPEVHGRHRPRHAARLRPPRADRVHGAGHPAGQARRGLRPGGHRLGARPPARPRLPAAGRGDGPAAVPEVGLVPLDKHPRLQLPRF